MASHYRELLVWQKSIVLVTGIYRLTGSFPKSEQFGLVGQLRRAAVSIPSNIAEGQGRLTAGEFRQFLGYARGSLAEVHTQLIISQQLGFATVDSINELEKLIEDTGRMLNGLLRSIGKSSG